jgi:O-antigen ligase
MIPALLVSLFLYWKNIGRPVMRRASIAFAFVILFFVVSPFINQALYWFRVNSLEENFLDRAASIYDLNEQSNVGRLVIWKDSLTYATTHPFGVGYGNFIVSLVPNIPEGTSFEQVGQLENLRYNLPQKFVTAHSLYLNILVELGIVGLFVFLMFIATYFKEIYHFIMANRNSISAYSAFTVSFALIFLWILAYGVFDVTLFNDKVLLYVFISLGLSAVIIRKRTMFSDENLIEQKK